MKKLTVFFCLFLIFSATWAQKTDLKLNLKVGETYSQKNQSSMSIAQNVQGMEMDIAMKMLGEMTYLVKDFSDGVYDMEVQYKHIELDMQMPQGGGMKLKSGDDTNPMSKMFTNMVGVPFSIKVTQYGRIQELAGFENLYVKMFQDFPGISEEQKAQMKEQVSGTFGEESLRGNLEMIMAIYPTEQVAVGENWTIESQLSSGVNTLVNTAYTYLGTDESYHKISGMGSINSNPNAVEMQGMSVKSEMTGTMKSDILLDKKTGWVYEARVSQEIEGATVLEGNPQMPDGMRIPMKMKADLLFTDK
ncbi:hypothetical protein GYM62_19710 [Algoriphagus sp. NBT04N3]|jgi:hypothetical protein|uniref:DUF6263 family protein n=1 Tax=Algoriphagus sp. NBT04N3 TaxID=2705473 RepID=UPI001C62C78B|nr:DUF6263 family protein [Algoriphagus sp. NBT04N3]QYH40916.1 hypothetical protein GYM62_19710 [Algoriphagus sp. NBT04N3]